MRRRWKIALGNSSKSFILTINALFWIQKLTTIFGLVEKSEHPIFYFAFSLMWLHKLYFHIKLIVYDWNLRLNMRTLLELQNRSLCHNCEPSSYHKPNQKYYISINFKLKLDRNSFLRHWMSPSGKGLDREPCLCFRLPSVVLLVQQPAVAPCFYWNRGTYIGLLSTCSIGFSIIAELFGGQLPTDGKSYNSQIPK